MMRWVINLRPLNYSTDGVVYIIVCLFINAQMKMRWVMSLETSVYIIVCFNAQLAGCHGEVGYELTDRGNIRT